MSGISTIDATGAVTISAGNVLLTNTAAQSNTYSGGAGQNLAIFSRNGDVTIESVLVSGTAVSRVSTLEAGSAETIAAGDILLTDTEKACRKP